MSPNDLEPLSDSLFNMLDDSLVAYVEDSDEFYRNQDHVSIRIYWDLAARHLMDLSTRVRNTLDLHREDENVDGRCQECISAYPCDTRIALTSPSLTAILPIEDDVEDETSARSRDLERLAAHVARSNDRARQHRDQIRAELDSLGKQYVACQDGLSTVANEALFTRRLLDRFPTAAVLNDMIDGMRGDLVTLTRRVAALENELETR